MYMSIRVVLFAGIGYCAWELPLANYLGIFALIAFVELVTVVRDA